jgi:hypothetical protein
MSTLSRVAMNNELNWSTMWQKAAVSGFEMLFRHLPGGNERNPEKVPPLTILPLHPQLHDPFTASLK